MALAPKLVYVDMQSATPCSTVSGTPLTWPSLTAGGKITISLRFLEGDGGTGFIQKYQYVANIRAGMGLISSNPNSGSFRIVVDGDSTGLIPYNCDPKRVQDALNALVGTSDPFSVEQSNDVLLLRRVSGSAVNLDATANTLRPFSAITFPGTVINGQWTYRMVIKNVPLAFTDTAFQILPDPPSVTILQHGGSDAGGTVWPTIQDLYVPPTFQGTYQLTRNFGKSALMDITDGATQVQQYINTMLAQTDKGAQVSVTNPTSYHVNITFGVGANDPLEGADVPALGVNIYSAPPGDWSFTLDLGSAEMLAAFAGKTTMPLQFECEADFFVSQPIPGQLLPATTRAKLWSQPVTVKNPMLHADLNTVQLIDWAKPPTGRDYVPFTLDQIITGQQNYTTTLGNNSATVFEITHRLNTDAIASVCVRENKTHGRMLVEGVDYTVVFNDANSLALMLEAPPASNALSVTIMAAGVTTAFETHTHTIQQVTTLADQLEQLSLRIAYLEGLVPHSGAFSVATQMPDQVTTLPSFGEMLPDLSLENTVIPHYAEGQSVGLPPPVLPVTAQISAKDSTAPIILIPGTPLKQATDADATKLAIITATAQEKTKQDTELATNVAVETVSTNPPVVTDSKTLATFMVPAVAGAVTSNSATPYFWPPMRSGKLQRLPSTQRSAPSSVTSAPAVTQTGVYLASQQILVPGAHGRKRFGVAAGSYFASDGTIFYPVASTSANVWYPTEMDRELSRTYVPSQTFPTGASLSLSLDLTTVLNTPGFDSPGIDLGCEYALRVRAIPVANGAAGTPAILLSTPIAFSPSSEQRMITITANRNGPSSATVYGTSIAGDAIPSGDVVLVVDLTEFDVDTTQQPVGQLGLIMQSTKILITK